MRTTKTLASAGIAAIAALGLFASPSFAACKRMGFLVNDYGKDGPTKDAKELLDKHIAKEMGEKGIKNYKVGEKSVKCELFLNFVVFDEHTCTASANVCWDGTPMPKAEQAEANATPAADKTDAKASKSTKPATTGSVDKASENAQPKSENTAKPVKPASADAAKADAEKSETKSAETPKTETKSAEAPRAEAKPEPKIETKSEVKEKGGSSKEHYESVPDDLPEPKQ